MVCKKNRLPFSISRVCVKGGKDGKAIIFCEEMNLRGHDMLLDAKTKKVAEVNRSAHP